MIIFIMCLLVVHGLCLHRAHSRIDELEFSHNLVKARLALLEQER